MMTFRVIPVPIPNTEVKLYVPKILGGFLPGKIGLRQFFYFFIKTNYKDIVKIFL